MNDDFFKYRDRFIELAERIEIGMVNKNFKIVVLGKFIAGKSTLIHALLGEKIMAMQATAGTGVISEIEYGDDLNNISVIFTDGSKKFYDYDGFVKEMTWTDIDQYELDNDNENIDGYFSRFDKIHHATIQCTNKFLKNSTTLIEAPGIGERNTTVQHDYLPSASAIIFILDATALFSRTEREFINENFAGKGMCNVFFVINRVNQLSNFSQLDSIVKPIVKRNLQDIFKNEIGNFDEELYNKRVFYVDAYGALCAATNTPSEVFVGGKFIETEISKDETGFPEFEASLEQYHLESELQRMAKIYNDNTNNLGHKHRNEFVQTQNIEVYSQMRLLLELAYEAVYGEQPTEADLRQLVI